MLWDEKLRGNINAVRYPAYVDFKIDGELVFWDGLKLTNKYGTDKTYLPLCASLPPISVYGELFYEDGKDFYNGILSHQKELNLKVMLFDIEDGDQPYSDRRCALNHLEYSELVLPIISGLAQCKEDVDKIYQEAIKQGYEGVVVKSAKSRRWNEWVKIKRETTIDLAVLGIEKGKSAVSLGIPPKQVICHSTLLGQQELIDLLSKEVIIGEDKENYYVEAKYVVEVKTLGIIRRNGSWSLRNPNIKRIRWDKGIIDVERR